MHIFIDIKHCFNLLWHAICFNLHESYFEVKPNV